MSPTARQTIPDGDRPTSAVALTPVPDPAPALAELERVLEVFRTVNRGNKDVVSDARLKQLEWVASELAIALPLGLTETAGDSLADLLAPDAAHAYLALGRAGLLRTMPTVDPDPTSAEASERIRIFCLEAIARQARVRFEAPEMPRWQVRPTVSPRFGDLISQHLQREAEKWPPADRPDLIVRGLAMWAVMRDALPRLGELESMRLSDLTLTAGTRTLTVIRQPQGGLRGKMPEPETVELTEHTARLLADWLQRRQALVDRLHGGAPPHLWLSIDPNHTVAADGTVVSRIAGLPLMRRGISKWYLKVAQAVQREQDAAGVPASGLVPTRWETMRRTLLAQRDALQTAA